LHHASDWNAGRPCETSGPALKVLRESGFATVRIDGARRLYSMQTAPLREVDSWLERFRGMWEPRLDALATEIARGKRKRR